MWHHKASLSLPCPDSSLQLDVFSITATLRASRATADQEQDSNGLCALSRDLNGADFGAETMIEEADGGGAGGGGRLRFSPGVCDSLSKPAVVGFC